MKSTRPLVAIFAFIAAFCVALLLDAPIARFFRQTGIELWFDRDRDLREFLKLPGEGATVAVIAVIIFFAHRARLRGALFIVSATLLTSITVVTKWMVGRHRPFTWLNEQSDILRPFEFVPFRDGLHGMFTAWNLCFPSGHTATAFALAAGLAMLWPRGRWVFFAVATVTGLERIIENAHWTSDVVAAAGLGILCAHACRLMIRGAMEPKMQVMEQHATAARLPIMVDVSPPTGTPPYLSLVIPAYNEQENIPTLLSRVGASLSQINRPFEVVIVDDGSKDETPKLLAEAMKQYPWLRVLRMARNGGQSAAFEAGFEAARGEVIATIDADLQNDPEEIPRLLPLLDEMNVDMITGWRKDRQDTPFRRWQSRQANRIRNWISQETVNDSASSLKLYRAHAVKGLKLFNGAHRFFPTLVKMRGYTCYETPVKHSPRFAGTAKYGFRNRAFRAFVDLLAVRWMKTRWLRYSAAEVPKEDGSR